MARFKWSKQEKQRPDLMEYLPEKGFKRFAILYIVNFWKITTSSLWTLLLCTPLLTSGLASAGMTYVARNAALNNHIFGTLDFFDTVKKNWKQAITAGVINLLINAILVYASVMCYLNANSLTMVFVLITLVELFAFFTLVQHYLWHIVVTFHTSLIGAYAIAVRLSVVGFKRNILALFSLLVFDVLVIANAFIPWPQLQLLLYMILLCVMFGYRTYAVSYCIFPVIKKHVIIPYYEANPNADVELLKQLNMTDDS